MGFASATDGRLEGSGARCAAVLRLREVSLRRTARRDVRSVSSAGRQHVAEPLALVGPAPACVSGSPPCAPAPGGGSFSGGPRASAVA